jgi:iron complex outermembrane receptor protein
VQLLYTPDLVAGRRSPGLIGALTARDALGRLLSGSGLSAQESRPGVIILRVAGVAQVDPDPQAAEAPVSTLTELVVTGTHIRGADAGASPILQIDRGEIDRQGYATVADALAALPQNFSGVASSDVASAGFDTTSQNFSRATTVNLRALGPDATLVLVNGRRMAGTGGKGDLADVSAIPAAVVDRVDVLLDGASALYGSDAVAGVVNILLKRDFEGAETRARYGAARGGADERLFAQTFGQVWSSGHALLSYEYYARDALAFSARDYTASADLRPFGGTDHRATNASPGNVLIFNPATNSSTPTYAIPAGATVFPLKPGDFRSGAVNLQTARQGMDLLPNQERNSAYASVTQALGNRIEVTADLRYSRRASNSNSVPPAAIVNITDANPYFASPNGARAQQIAYSFYDDLGPTHAFSVGRSLGTSLGATLKLWGDWRADLYGAYADEKTNAGTTGNLNSLFLNEALGTSADNPATAFSTATNGFFNPYGSGRANSRAVLDFIGSGYSRQRFESQVTSFNLEADGKVWALPGGDLRLALGAHARREVFDQYQESQLSSVKPAVSRPARQSRTVNAVFAELRAPLVGPDNAVPGVRRLELSLAGRLESYSDAGSTTDPKVGLTWEPVEGLRLRTTYGTSFRAPGLTEINLPQTISAFTITNAGARLLALDVDGGNRDLKPETATSWTAGVDWSPTTLPGLKLSATWFDTDFANQIDRPVFRFLASGVTNPVIAPFVQFVSPASAADQAKIQALLNDPTYTSPGLFPASAFGVLLDTRYVNTGRLHVRGVDAQASYGFDRGRDHFDLSFNGTYLLRYEQQLTPTAPTGDFANIAGQPIALRTRAALSWRREDLGATLGVNYAGAYKSSLGRRIDDWTTADLQVSWSPSRGPLKDLAVSVSVQNLLDADPPFYDAPQGVGYDAANADPVGRVAAGDRPPPGERAPSSQDRDFPCVRFSRCCSAPSRRRQLLPGHSPSKTCSTPSRSARC